VIGGISAVSVLAAVALVRPQEIEIVEAEAAPALV
jgi:hypothetical protein